MTFKENDDAYLNTFNHWQHWLIYGWSQLQYRVIGVPTLRLLSYTGPMCFIDNHIWTEYSSEFCFYVLATSILTYLRTHHDTASLLQNSCDWFSCWNNLCG